MGAMISLVQCILPWSSLVLGDEGSGSAEAESCVYVEPKKFMQHMHSKIPKLFDYWADPVAHFLLLKSSMILQMIER